MNEQTVENIRKAAKALDDAVERDDREAVLNCFSEDGEVELFGLRMRGKTQIRDAIDWMFNTLGKIRFEPRVIMIDGDTFFEEFVLVAQRPDGSLLRVDAAEVLIYEDCRVKSLRLYFDRLALAGFAAKGAIEKSLIHWLEQVTLKGLAGSE